MTALSYLLKSHVVLSKFSELILVVICLIVCKIEY